MKSRRVVAGDDTGDTEKTTAKRNYNSPAVEAERVTDLPVKLGVKRVRGLMEALLTTAADNGAAERQTQEAKRDGEHDAGAEGLDTTSAAAAVVLTAVGDLAVARQVPTRRNCGSPSGPEAADVQDEAAHDEGCAGRGRRRDWRRSFAGSGPEEDRWNEGPTGTMRAIAGTRSPGPDSGPRTAETLTHEPSAEGSTEEVAARPSTRSRRWQLEAERPRPTARVDLARTAGREERRSRPRGPAVHSGLRHRTRGSLTL